MTLSGRIELPVDEAASVLRRLRASGGSLSLAESCTGGLLGAALTSVPGSSDAFEGGIVAYSDRVKQELLGVSRGAFEDDGAVSEVVAREMARGAAARFDTAWAVAVTGIAGPGGGRPDKPVGTVWIAVTGPRSDARRYRFEGDRQTVRLRSAEAALELLGRLMDDGVSPPAAG